MLTDEQVKNMRGAFCPSIEYASALGFIVSGRRPQTGALSLEVESLAVRRSRSGDSRGQPSTDGVAGNLDRRVSQIGKGGVTNGWLVLRPSEALDAVATRRRAAARAERRPAECGSQIADVP